MKKGEIVQKAKTKPSLNQDSEVYHANEAIQNRFYGEKMIEDDIDTSLSMNSNIGAVLLPENEEG